MTANRQRRPGKTSAACVSGVPVAATGRRKLPIRAVAAHTSDPIGAWRTCVAYLSVWLSNGALAHVHVNWLSPTKIRTTVFGGSRRTIIWDDTNPARRLAIHDRSADTPQAGTVPQD